MKKSNLGRPRGFDADAALDRALEVFSQNGYEGASLSDLTSAMGITRPSLYAAFGNKEELFRKALDRYCARSAAYMSALNNGSAYDGIRGFLTEALGDQCGTDRSRGCLLVKGALSCSEESENVSRELASRRALMECALRERLDRARREGEIPAHADPADLARYFATVSQGLSVQAVGGASTEDLMRVIDAAMRAWP